MKETKCEIGFHDQFVMLIMIPLTAFFVPIIFFGRRIGREPYFTGRIYLTAFIVTSVLWLGNRFILILTRRRYPLFEETRKRLLVQGSVMFVFTIIATNGLGYLFKDYCGLMSSADVKNRIIDTLIGSNSAALFCTVTVIAIYESIYFIKQLRRSVEEKEMLKRESLRAQINELKTQVNPHFLFNNLNTLSAIIPENPKQAVDFVQQMSKVYRHILEVKDEKSISLKDELDVLNAYSFLLKTRFGDNLSVNINVPEEKLQDNIVPLSLQILMENAIKHNIVSSEKPLQIDVFTENGNLVVKNNLQMKKQVTESTGIGLHNIRNRYKLLGDKEVKVTENGTNFIVSIPLIKN